MTHKQVLFSLFISLTNYFNVSGQVSPPPMAMPKDSSIIVIDRIIDVTKHEEYFIEYCTEKVNKYASLNNWEPTKTKQILESIKFKDYNHTIYNSYAFYSINQLNSILKALTLLNTDPKNHMTMVLTNSMMQVNLEFYVESLIEGKYIRSK